MKQNKNIKQNTFFFFFVMVMGQKLIYELDLEELRHWQHAGCLHSSDCLVKLLNTMNIHHIFIYLFLAKMHSNLTTDLYQDWNIHDNAE